MQQPTLTNVRVSSTRDALQIFYAVARRVLPMITRRLDAEERRAIVPGNVYIWEERCANAEVTGLGMERWSVSVSPAHAYIPTRSWRHRTPLFAYAMFVLCSQDGRHLVVRVAYRPRVPLLPPTGHGPRREFEFRALGKHHEVSPGSFPARSRLAHTLSEDATPVRAGRNQKQNVSSSRRSACMCPSQTIVRVVSPENGI